VGYFLKSGVWRALPSMSVRQRLVWIATLAGKAAGLFVLGSMLLVLVLRWVPLPGSSYMVQTAISAWWSGQGPLRYEWTPYARIAPAAALAVIAGEDQRFPEHHGFDFVEIQDALEDQDEGKPMRGASTLSQQVAKNLFLWPGRSLLRKALEAWFTVLLELFWSKQRILEVYLNIAEFGERTFGVGAASLRFFAKPAARLSNEEAARLAAVLPNPLRYRVEQPSAYVRARQRWIEQQMRQLGGTTYLDGL